MPMQIRILNPQTLQNLYKNHGDFARICYDTDEKYAERVGRSCQKDGHLSGSRCEYIKFEITGIDRGTAEQALRHEIGTYVPFEYQDNYSLADYSELIKEIPADQIVKNMASFRYIDKDGFDYAIPTSVANCPPAKAEYMDIMAKINASRASIRQALIDHGCHEKTATQDANFLLPRATTTSFIIGFTPEALIHFCHKRLCTRAQEFIRQMAIGMRQAVADISPEFASELKPQCKHLLWCPEGKRCCGIAPTKEELVNRLASAGAGA